MNGSENEITDLFLAKVDCEAIRKITLMTSKRDGSIDI